MIKNNLVTIIIPTKNSKLTIENCLKSIKRQSYKAIEIIVVDNNSSDNTVEIAKKFTSKIYIKGPERSAQRNFGALKSSGKFLLFIDSDMELSSDVVTKCIDESKFYKAIIVPEKSYGTSFWAKCKSLERSFYLGVEWIESARFFSKDIFNEFNGYDINNTGTEDFDLPQRIKNKYGNKSIGRISKFIMHNEGKLALFKTMQKKYYYSRKLAVYRINNEKYFIKQANLLNRYLLYFSKPDKLFNNPLIGLGMLFMKTCEFTAGGLGYIKGL